MGLCVCSRESVACHFLQHKVHRGPVETELLPGVVGVPCEQVRALQAEPIMAKPLPPNSSRQYLG